MEMLFGWKILKYQAVMLLLLGWIFFCIYLVVKLLSSTTPLPRSRSRSNCRACKSEI